MDVPLLKLVIEKLGTSVKIRTFDMLADAYLGGIYLQYLRLKSKFEQNVLSVGRWVA